MSTPMMLGLAGLFLLVAAGFTLLFAGSRKFRRATETPRSLPEDTTMPTTLLEDPHPISTPLYRAAHFLGYQKARIVSTEEETGLRRKFKLAKWGVRVVRLLGVKTSSKLAWTALKIKKKLDHHKSEAA